MKKIGLIILFVLLAFSCKNSIDNKNSKKGYGLINFTSTSRTVQAAFDVESFEDICLYGKNIAEETDYILLKTWDVYDSFISDLLSIAVGSYEFYLTAKIGNVEFKSDIESVVILENTITEIIFELIVTNRGTEKGFVDLEFTFGEGDYRFPVTHGSFELNKITYEDNVRKSEPISVNSNLLVVTPYDGQNNTDASATFNAELDSGVYELISRFEILDEGVAVYPVTIHVSEGQTSRDEIEVLNFNKYYSIEYNGVEEQQISGFPTKYSIYDEVTIQNLTDEGYNKFQGWYTEADEKIEKISKYERTGNLSLSAKWHLDSQYMLFSKGYDAESKQDVYTFAMTSDLSSIVESENVVNSNITDFTIGGGDFYYYITKSSDEVFLCRTDTDNETFKISIPVDSAYVNKISNYIYWDYEFDKLYVLQIKLDGVTPNNNTIEKVLLYDPNNAEAPFVSFEIRDDYSDSLIKNDYSTYDFAVHNDKLYIGFSNPDEGLYVSEFEINEDGISFNTDIPVDSNTSYNYNPICLNDMIWMNDSLYLLWSVNGSASGIENYYSYGNIFRMTETKDNEYSISKLNLPVKKIFEINYNNEETWYRSYYGPSSENDNNYLFGPTKFIAIKPKKLVVADEGILIYEDENESNKIKMKNIDRVVELDLDNNSITPTILDDITFNKESVEKLQIVCGYFNLTEDGLEEVE